MPLVQAKCENCNGILKVDSAKKAAICPYCGTPYVVQDAINNYITNIGSLHADVVNVSDDKSAKARLEAADAFMKLHKYREAWGALNDVCSLTPQNYRGWWGKIRVITEDFSLRIDNKSKLDEINTLYQSALLFVPDADKNAIEEQFNAYFKPLEEDNSTKCNNLKQRIRNLQSENSSLNTSISELEKLDFPKVGCLSNGIFYLSIVVFFIGTVMELVYEKSGAMVVTGIPPVLSLFWEIFIRPVKNTISEKNRKNANKELEKMRSRREVIQEELRKAQKQLEKLSD